MLEIVNERLSYDKNTGHFVWRANYGRGRAGSIAGQVSGWGYIRIPIQRKKYAAHRLAWLVCYGEFPACQIDHIDGNKQNNAINNLRAVSPSLNQLYNEKPRANNKIGLLGVRKMGKKFSSQIRVEGHIKYLGVFDTPAEASAAYLSEKVKVIAAKRAHGIGGGV